MKIESLNTLKNNLDKVLKIIENISIISHCASNINNLNVVSEILEKSLNSIHKLKKLEFSGYDIKINFAICINNIKGIKAGLLDEELSEVEADTLLGKIYDSLMTILNVIDQEIQDKTDLKARIASKEPQEDPFSKINNFQDLEALIFQQKEEKEKQTYRDDFKHKQDYSLEKLITKYEEVGKKLPVKFTNDIIWQIIKLPILILTYPTINTVDLDKTKVKYTNIYPGYILEDQLCLAFSSVSDYEKNFNYAKNIIEEKTNQQYVDMLEGSVFKSKRSQLVFAWLLNEKILSAIGSINIECISFPFDCYNQTLDKDVVEHKNNSKALIEDYKQVLVQKIDPLNRQLEDLIQESKIKRTDSVTINRTCRDIDSEIVTLELEIKNAKTDKEAQTLQNKLDNVIEKAKLLSKEMVASNKDLRLIDKKIKELRSQINETKENTRLDYQKRLNESSF